MIERYRGFGLIGKKLDHSFSDRFFNDKFAREHLNAKYELIPIESLDLFPDIISKNKFLEGLNITIPYKIDIIRFLDSISDEASKCGAVNTIKIERQNGKTILKGFNTDITGFRNSLKPLLKAHHKCALIFGTGGASLAVRSALTQLGIKYKSVSRSGKNGSLLYQDLNQEIMNECHILINTTPLGTFPKIDEAVNIPYEFVNTSHIAYDLVYNPEETKFLSLCKEKGAFCINGLEMLHIQAEEAWKIWNNE